jgi:hypothetical protein
MMTTALFLPASPEPNSAQVGQFSTFIQTWRQDLQTGLVDVDFKEHGRHSLLFARGELVNVYLTDQPAVRLDAQPWLESLSGSSPAAVLRSLALTPQGVRIIKILIEQSGDMRFASSGDLTLENQFAAWMVHPLPALAHIRWPEADAVVLLPGQGVSPRYTLFLSAEKILHSAGSLAAIYAWKETPVSSVLYSSGSPTLAWSEYLLHHAFSRMMGSLLDKFEKLTGRMVFNQVIHDVNFTASAHDWNITLHASGINDQAVFSSPQAAALVYARMLQSLSGHIASVVGGEIQELLVRETVARVTMPYRGVLKEYLFPV